LLKRDATRIRISSKGNTTDISIPANKQNRWNPAWGLREQKINFTAPNQTGIGWNNATKVATVPAGIYHIFFKHILYDCGIGEKGTQLAFYKENGTTLAVEGVDYILSNDFIQSEKFYDPVSARTRIFKNGGYFQVINPIVLKPQLWWTRSTSRGSGLAHRQAGIAATDQDILSITRLDSGVELENINES
jgi:5-hydroxyisourate hydrolase-like protein (transthyretin family)